MTHKSLTENQLEYEKQLQRIGKIIKQVSKEGFDTSKIEIPKKPKRITKQYIQSLKEITPKTLRSSLKITNVETGEILTGRYAQQYYRESRPVKPIMIPQYGNISDDTEEYYPTMTATESVIDGLEQLEQRYGNSTQDAPVQTQPNFGATTEGVLELISTLKRISPPPIPIENRKQNLLTLFDNMIAYFDDDVRAIENYLNQHYAEIASACEDIAYDSGQGAYQSVSVAFADIGAIFNMGNRSDYIEEMMSTYGELGE